MKWSKSEKYENIWCLHARRGTWIFIFLIHVINIRLSEYCVLFALAIFTALATAISHRGSFWAFYGTVKCQDGAAAYPRHLERRENRAATDVKRALTFWLLSGCRCRRLRHGSGRVKMCRHDWREHGRRQGVSTLLEFIYCSHRCIGRVSFADCWGIHMLSNPVFLGIKDLKIIS